MKKITEMTRKEFDELKHRDWDEDVICDSIVILPGRAKDKHDSGFRCMDFVAVIKDKPVCLLSGGSDVIHIDGIGGISLGRYSDICEGAWSIDCLPKSGLLRLWPTRTNCMKAGPALSSFEIFAVKKKKE